jgi:hypothetical protein
MTNTWTYQTDLSTSLGGRSLDGYDVIATDGSIGSIDESTSANGSGYLVVDTGFWIFGKKRLIPAGVVTAVDTDKEEVHVSLTKEEIKNAPDFDDTWDRSSDDWYRTNTGDYYDRWSW